MFAVYKHKLWHFVCVRVRVRVRVRTYLLLLHWSELTQCSDLYMQDSRKKKLLFGLMRLHVVGTWTFSDLRPEAFPLHIVCGRVLGNYEQSITPPPQGRYNYGKQDIQSEMDANRRETKWVSIKWQECITKHRFGVTILTENH